MDHKERERLLEALWQLLDDMGPDGQRVCQGAKQQAMEAYAASLPNECSEDRPSAFDSI